MDDRQALANEILQTALAECVAPRQDHLPDAAQMVANSFTNEDLEGMAHGDNPVANAYRELLGRRHITDVASTILYSLGLDVPSDFEGVVPPAMFTADHKAAHPIKIGAPTVRNQQDGVIEAMDEDEKKQIMEQLQMLGYME